MKVFLCVFVAFLALSSAEITPAPLYAADSPTAIKGEYVVILKEELTDDDVAGHMQLVRSMMAYEGNSSKILGEYNIGTFRGYGAMMSDKLRERIRNVGHVKYMEYNQVYKIQQANCKEQLSATWGIVRTTEHNLPTVLDYSYSLDCDGEGVDAYIIDTGIDTSHPDFGGRAKWGTDTVDNPSPRTDLNGHGTHVAGTVMANTWGLAKKATSVAVRVLNANGSGTTAGVISGIDWVANEHSSGKKSVANMSLGGGKSTSLNNAVAAAVGAGVHFAIAAGNEGQDACNVSPASACQDSPCLSVAASDSSDQIAYFSNYGEKCTHLIGPGVSVTSTWLNGGTNTISGTSMAAPHVAGVIAKYLSCPGASYTPASMREHLQKEATKDKISGLTGSKSSTPNLLVFKECA